MALILKDFNRINKKCSLIFYGVEWIRQQGSEIASMPSVVNMARSFVVPL
jgi:hypothetical protein